MTTAAWLPVISVARRSDHKRPALLYGLLLLLEASYLAIFSCDHAIWLCAALQVNSVLLYLLTTGWSEQASEGLAKKMLFVNLAADFVILIGLMGVVIAFARVSAPEPNTLPTLTYSLSEITRDLPRLTTDDVAAQEYWKHAQRSLLSILILGAAIKAPLVPFHAWFAAVVAEGPPCVAIALVGAGLRIGLYLLARFIGPLCGELGGVADLIVGLTILGAFLESLLTYGQANLKKMIACICLLQGSLAVAGFFSMRPGKRERTADVVAGQRRRRSADHLFSRLSRSCGTGRRSWRASAESCIGCQILPRSSCWRRFRSWGSPDCLVFPGCSRRSARSLSGEWTFAFLAIGSCLIGAWALFSMLQHLVFGSLRLPVPGAADVLIDRESPLVATLDPSDPPQASWNTDATPREWSIVTEGRSGSIDLSAKELLLLGPLLVSLVALGIWPQAISAALRLALVGSSLSP